MLPLALIQMAGLSVRQSKVTVEPSRTAIFLLSNPREEDKRTLVAVVMAEVRMVMAGLVMAGMIMAGAWTYRRILIRGIQT